MNANSNIQIKKYDLSYKPQILNLFSDFQNYLANLDPLKRLRTMPGYAKNTLMEILADIKKKDGGFYLAVMENKVVGFIVSILEKQSPHALLGSYPAVIGRITELYVNTNLRGSGIGSKLMEHAESYLKNKGCEYIWLEVFLPNQDAHNFYKKLGYEDRDVQMIKKTNI